MKSWLVCAGVVFLLGFETIAQKKVIEMGETMEQFIKENHIEKIESMIHKLASSRTFIDMLLQKGHNLPEDIGKLQKKDVNMGKDIDIYVKHFTEHQNFTMVLVPVSIYKYAIYDTLLFSVLEVSKNWLEHEFPYENIADDSTKHALLALKNHNLLSEHLYHQALGHTRTNMGQVDVVLNESYISTGAVETHMSNLSHEEKELFREHWGLFKKAFAHSVNLDIEMNIYIFGFEDMEVKTKGNKGEYVYRVTPKNIFQRHHFQEN